MRRGVGVSGAQQRKKTADAFSSTGRALEQTKMQHVQDTLTKFQETLATFAMQHKERIDRDPEFRLQFYSMCDGVGIDPLTSSKGMWTDVLGIGDFYYDLGLRIIRQCIKTRAVNGGIMKVADIVHRINASTAKGGAVVSCDDVKRAVLKLSVLDKCFRVIDLGEPYVMSVPLELSMDHQAIIAVASSYSYACFSLLEAMHGWTTERFDTAISFLLQEEVVWVDDNNGSEKRYMMPSSSLG